MLTFLSTPSLSLSTSTFTDTRCLTRTHFSRSPPPPPPCHHSPFPLILSSIRTPPNQQQKQHQQSQQSQQSQQQQQKHDIRLICCDMDGTILDDSSNISSRNITTVKRLLSQNTDIHFIPATGKSRAGALNSMKALGTHLQHLHNDNVPGVYLQGLVVYGQGGEKVYEKTLEEDVAWDVIEHAKNHGITLVAYNGDRIVGVTENDRTRDIARYHEPTPEYVKSWDKVIGKVPVHKFLFLDDAESVEEFRPGVKELVGDRGAITTAIPTMLEVLPPGASKGLGVLKLLDSYGVNPDYVMAIGDGENDLEMMENVKYSVAMGNAVKVVKDVAKYHVDTNDNHGLSEALERFVL